MLAQVDLTCGSAFQAAAGAADPTRLQRPLHGVTLESKRDVSSTAPVGLQFLRQTPWGTDEPAT